MADSYGRFEENEIPSGVFENLGDGIVVEWLITDANGRRKAVDPFTFIKETLGISDKVFKKTGLGAILGGPGRIFMGPGAESKTRLNFAINTELLSQGVDIEVFRAGMAKLKEILGNPQKMEELAYKAYVQGAPGFPSVKKLLQRYLGEQKALTILKLSGASGKFSRILKSKNGKVRVQKFQVNFKQRAEKYSTVWSNLVNNVILGNPTRLGGGVISFSLRDLMAPEYSMSSLESPYTSIFLMEEFGTGLNVDEATLRTYIKSGKFATPFKVPPEIAAAFNYPEAIALWWPMAWFRKLAYRLYAYQLEQQKEQVSQAKRMHAMRTALKVSNKAVSLKEFKEFAKKRMKQRLELGKLTNPLEMAYGERYGGKPIGHYGRQARHLFFDRQGVVERIKEIQQDGYRALFKLIDEEIKAAGIKGFPSIYNIVFRGIA
jgi:hypothetical protein